MFIRQIFSKKLVAWNTFIQLLGKGIFGATAFFLVGYLTRKLGAKGFGECMTLFAWISTLIVIADMGLYMTGVRRISMAAKTVRVILGNLLSARILVSVVVVGVGTATLLLLPYDVRIKKIIIFALPIVILVSGSRTFKSWFQADLIMHCSVVCEVAGCIVVGLLTFYTVEYSGFYRDSIYGVIFAFIAGCFVYCALAVFFSIAGKTFKISFDIKYIKDLIIEAFPLGFSAVLAILYFRFDMLMLSWMKPAEHVGIYGAAYTVVEMSVVIPALFLGSMLPFFTKAIVLNKDNLNHHYQKAFDFLVLLAIPGLAGGILLADPIMNLITGFEFGRISGMENYGGSTFRVFQILVMVSALMFWGQLNGHLLVAGEKQKLILKIYYFLLPLNVCLNLLFIPKYSYIGAAIATLICEMVAIIITTAIVKKKFDQFPALDFLFKSLFATIIMVLVLSFIDFNVIVMIGIGMVVYCFIMLSFFTKEVLNCF